MVARFASRRAAIMTSGTGTRCYGRVAKGSGYPCCSPMAGVAGGSSRYVSARFASRRAAIMTSGTGARRYSRVAKDGTYESASTLMASLAGSSGHNVITWLAFSRSTVMTTGTTRDDSRVIESCT